MPSVDLRSSFMSSSLLARRSEPRPIVIIRVKVMSTLFCPTQARRIDKTAQPTCGRVVSFSNVGRITGEVDRLSYLQANVSVWPGLEVVNEARRDVFVILHG